MLYPSMNTQKRWILFLIGISVFLHLYFHFSFEGSLKERARWIDSFFSRILWPIEKTVVSVREAAGGSVDYLARLKTAETQNRVLEAEVSQLRAKLSDLREIEQENRRLTQLLDFTEGREGIYLPARVIGRDLSPYFRSLSLNRGSKDGVQRSMAVISPQGAVGQIVQVDPFSSVVLLINDVNSRLDALSEFNRVQTIVGGAPSGNLLLRHLPRRNQIAHGDLLVTSGIGDFFPKGVPVGYVVGKSEDPHSVLEGAELEPVVPFESLEEVLIVISRGGRMDAAIPAKPTKP